MLLQILHVQKPSHTASEKGFNFNDDMLMHGAWRNGPNLDMCKVIYHLSNALSGFFHTVTYLLYMKVSNVKHS